MPYYARPCPIPQTPLMVAAHNGDLDAMTILLQWKADPDKVVIHFPLRLFCSSMSVPIVPCCAVLLCAAQCSDSAVKWQCSAVQCSAVESACNATGCAVLCSCGLVLCCALL